MFQAQMFLADFAQATPDGKLTAVGMGWTVTGPQPVPHAVGVVLQIPWDQTNVRHHLLLELLDADGQPVLVPTAEGAKSPLRLEGELITGRPAELAPGTPVNVPFAFFQAGLLLSPGGRYVYQLSINGQTEDDWRLPFSVRQGPQQMAA